VIPARKRRAAVTRIAAAVAAVCSVTLLGATPLPRQWENWKYSRAILAATVNERSLTVVAIPLDVLKHAQGSLDDLRVIDAEGEQVPYVLRLPPGSPIEISRPSTVRENIFSKGEYSQVVLDIGQNVSYHNVIAFGTTGPEYVVTADVAASNDDANWQDVATSVKLSHFGYPPQESEQSIHYSVSNARFVRLRILEGGHPFPILHPQLEYLEASPDETTPLAVEFIPDSNAPAGRSRWSLDLGSEGAPAIAVGFQTSEPEFRRRVDIRYGPKQGTFGECSGEIYRLERNGEKFERLSLPVRAFEAADRYWQVDVTNGDDQPLEGLQPTLYVAPRRVVFWQEPGKNYLLLYGQFRAKKPVYDLAARTDVKQLDAAVPATLGTEDSNTAYVPPIPWTERHEWLMWAALALALLLLGFTAVRSLSRIPQAKE